MMRSALQCAVMLTGLVLLIFNMVGNLPATAAPDRQNGASATLTVLTYPLTNLDPVSVSRFDQDTRDLVENVFVGLTRLNAATGEIEPMIARSWTTSPDGLTWTFELRDDVWWVQLDPSTGTVAAIRPVAAGDFVYAIQRACDPLRPSPVTANLMIIRGCQTVAQAAPEVINDLFIAREIGIRATGPTTLEVNLLFPAAYFLTLTSLPEFRPLAREVASAPGWASRSQTLMTNGPYTVQQWTASGMVLVRNPHWPDPYSGSIEQVEVRFSDDKLANAAAADFMRLAPEQAAAGRALYPDRLEHSAGTTLVMLGFSADRALVGLPDVRRALALSIDREALVAQLLPEQALAARQFTPAGVVAAPQSDSLIFDPTQAQAALSAAGYAGCANIPEKIIIAVPDDDPFWAGLAQFVTGQWSTHLGCNPALFEVQALPRVLMLELAHANYDSETIIRPHIWLTTWNADYPDANGWIADALHCRYGYMRTGRACNETDTLLDQAGIEPDRAQRVALYAEAEIQFFGPAGSFPVLPLYLLTPAWLQQPALSGVGLTGPARFDRWSLAAAPDAQ